MLIHGVRVVMDDCSVPVPLYVELSGFQICQDLASEHVPFCLCCCFARRSAIREVGDTIAYCSELLLTHTYLRQRSNLVQSPLQLAFIHHVKTTALFAHDYTACRLCTEAATRRLGRSQSRDLHWEIQIMIAYRSCHYI